MIGRGLRIILYNWDEPQFMHLFFFFFLIFINSCVTEILNFHLTLFFFFFLASCSGMMHRPTRYCIRCFLLTVLGGDRDSMLLFSAVPDEAMGVICSAGSHLNVSHRWSPGLSITDFLSVLRNLYGNLTESTHCTGLRSWIYSSIQ